MATALEKATKSAIADRFRLSEDRVNPRFKVLCFGESYSTYMRTVVEGAFDRGL
jgi:hypothetical protein